MPKAFGFSGRDIARIGKTVRAHEAAPGPRPLSDGAGHAKTQNRVVMFEVVSGPVTGVYVVKLWRRKPGGGYEYLSTIEVTMEDINA